MDTNRELRTATEFLRRRQKHLQKRVNEGGPKSFDVTEAKALDAVLNLVEAALGKVGA